VNVLEVEFGPGEVIVLGVGVDSLGTLQDFVSDMGFTAPVLVDDWDGQSACFITPGSEQLYEHYYDRVGTNGSHGPFPLQVVIDGQNRLAYSANMHQPELIAEVLRDLLGR
jgi:peroxiredoxin